MSRVFWTPNDDDAFINGLKQGLVDDPYGDWMTPHNKEVLTKYLRDRISSEFDETKREELKQQLVLILSKKDHFADDNGLFEVE